MWTSLTSIAVLVGNIVLSAQLARLGILEAFEPYNLAKRYASGLLPMLTLGLHLGVVKFIASARTEREKLRCFGASLVLVLLALLSLSLVILASPKVVSQAVLGTVDTRLTWAFWSYCVGTVAHTMTYSLFRARLQQTTANWNVVIAMVAAPSLIVALAPRSWDIASILFLTSAVMAAYSLIQIVPVFWRSLGADIWSRAARDAVGHMLAYSIPRIPAGVFAGMLMLVGPWMARQGSTALNSSYLLAGLTIARIGGASLQSFGLVLLPRIADMHAEGRSDAIGDITARLITIVGCMSAFVVPLAYAVTEDLAILWLGQEFLAAVPVIRVVILAIPGLLLHYVLVSVADGALRKPVGTHALGAGLLMTAIVSLIVDPNNASALAFAYVLGQTVAGCAIAAPLVARYHTRIPIRHIALLVIAGTLCALLVATVPMPDDPTTLARIARLVLTTLLSACGVTAGLWYAPSWLGFRGPLSRMIRCPRA